MSVAAEVDPLEKPVKINPLDYTHLIERFARQHYRPGRDSRDIRHAGWIGLLKSISHFNPKKHDVKFETYAHRGVKQEIEKYVLEFATPISVPQHVFWDASRVKGDKEGSAYRSALRLLKDTEFVRDLQPDRFTESILDHRGSTEAVDEADEAEGRKRRVQNLLSRLPAKWRDILVMRFGLDGREPMLGPEIGRRLGVTRSRVYQIEEQALEHLRGLL